MDADETRHGEEAEAQLRASIHWTRQQQAKSWDLPTRRHLLACICEHFMHTDRTLHRKINEMNAAAKTEES